MSNFLALFTMLSLAATARFAFTDEQDADAPEAPPAMRILIVLTNHDKLGDTGQPTGFYLSEASHPWRIFTDAHFTVNFASPKGGEAPIDPKSLDRSDAVNAAFLDDAEVMKQVHNTLALGDVDLSKYEAIFFAGGHGAMWDMPDSLAVQDAIRTMWADGKVVAAVCHGPAALVNVKFNDGRYLVAGREIAMFTNEEEEAVGLTQVVPFALETELARHGAIITEAANFKPNIAVSDRLVTGQNPASAAGVAKAVISELALTTMKPKKQPQ